MRPSGHPLVKQPRAICTNGAHVQIQYSDRHRSHPRQPGHVGALIPERHRTSLQAGTHVPNLPALGTHIEMKPSVSAHTRTQRPARLRRPEFPTALWYRLCSGFSLATMSPPALPSCWHQRCTTKGISDLMLEMVDPTASHPLPAPTLSITMRERSWKTNLQVSIPPISMPLEQQQKVQEICFPNQVDLTMAREL